MTELVVAALRCADRLHAGVIPIVGKRPVGEHGYGSASSEPAEILRLCGAAPRATGFGIAAGTTLLIVDVDDVEALGEIGELPRTLTARSGGGGFHLYYRRPVGLRLSYRRDRFPLGFEVKLGAGGCVAPPSLHESGERYRWARRIPPVAAPGWLLERLRAPERAQVTAPRRFFGGESAYGRAALERHAGLVAAAPEGARRNTLNGSTFAVAQLIAGGYVTAETIASVMLDAAISTGLPVAEARRTIARALVEGQARPWFPAVPAVPA